MDGRKVTFQYLPTLNKTASLTKAKITSCDYFVIRTFNLILVQRSFCVTLAHGRKGDNLY